MFLEKVIKELMEMRNYKISLIDRELLRLFIFTAKKGSKPYMRHISIIRKVAKILDVPPSFLVEIIKMEGLENEYC